MNKSKNGVVMTLETITPALAEEYLNLNGRNRKISEGQVLFYAKQMKAGEWKVTGDAIKFSDKGTLMDGQHRLLAVMNSKIPIEMYVARGLHETAFDVLDTGKHRNAGDLLSIVGVEKANNIAAIVRFILLFRSGVFSSGYHKAEAVTNHDILEFVIKNQNLSQTLDYVHKVYRDFRHLPVSTLGGLYFLLAEKNAKMVDNFYEQYRTGIDLKKGSPVYHLRDKYLRDITNKTKLTRREKVGLFIVAWNAFIKGQEVTSIRVPEKFPEIV